MRFVARILLAYTLVFGLGFTVGCGDSDETTKDDSEKKKPTDDEKKDEASTDEEDEASTDEEDEASTDEEKEVDTLADFEPVEEIAINCGGDAYEDENGIEYMADMLFNGGEDYSDDNAEIEGTEDDELYWSERYGEFVYTIPVVDGSYDVTLKMAEIYFSEAEQRVFSIKVEGENVVDQLDIFAEIGELAAHDVETTVEVSDGLLEIETIAEVENPKLNAIVVAPAE